jgi:hypothetical protein
MSTCAPHLLCATCLSRQQRWASAVALLDSSDARGRAAADDRAALCENCAANVAAFIKAQDFSFAAQQKDATETFRARVRQPPSPIRTFLYSIASVLFQSIVPYVVLFIVCHLVEGFFALRYPHLDFPESLEWSIYWFRLLLLSLIAIRVFYLVVYLVAKSLKSMLVVSTAARLSRSQQLDAEHRRQLFQSNTVREVEEVLSYFSSLHLSDTSSTMPAKIDGAKSGTFFGNYVLGFAVVAVVSAVLVASTGNWK